MARVLATSTLPAASAAASFPARQADDLERESVGLGNGLRHLDLEAAQYSVLLEGEGLAGQRDADGQRVLAVQGLVQIDVVRRGRRGCNEREQD